MKNTRVKMDKVGKTNEIYKEIYQKSFSAVMIVMTIYTVLRSVFSDAIEIWNTESLFLTIILNILSVIPASAICYIVYKCIYVLTVRCWVNEHKNIYVKGVWLHIHAKETIRVGRVKINQNFYSITAKNGLNVSPEIDEINPNHECTDWEYYMGEVFDDTTVRDFIGCYKAKRHRTDIQNDGIHVLQIVKCDNKGFPIYLRGRFSDTVKITKEDVISTEEHAGELFLFRPSKKLMDYLNNVDDIEDRLRNLYKNPDFQDEMCVKKLNEVIQKKHNKKEQMRIF